MRLLLALACLIPCAVQAAPADVNAQLAELESALKSLKASGMQPNKVVKIERKCTTLKRTLREWSHVAVTHGRKKAAQTGNSATAKVDALLASVKKANKLGNFEIQDLMSNFEEISFERVRRIR